MSRPTPTVSLSENELTALKTIMKNNPEGSTHFKRAAVLLACAEGKQGKAIAKEYQVTQNMVINWRRKFEQGGVEGLMTDAPKPGKRLTDSTKAKNIKKSTAPSGTDAETNCTRTKRESEQKASKPDDSTQSQIKSNLADDIARKIQEKSVQIIGLFLTMSIQILALVISPFSKEPLFPKGKRITVNTGVTKSQQQTKDDVESLDLANTLRCLSGLTPREEGNSTGEAIDFVENLRNSLKDTGYQLYLVLNAPDPTALVSDQSLIGMKLSSTEEFKTTSSLWFHALDGGSSWIANVFSKQIGRLLDTAPTNCAPFIWQVSPEGYQLQQSSSSQLSKGDNELTFSITFKDNTGATRTCSRVLVNAIPNPKDFAQCKTIYDFQRLAGKLEQGIITGSQELGNAFMNETMRVGSQDDQKKIARDNEQ